MSPICLHNGHFRHILFDLQVNTILCYNKGQREMVFKSNFYKVFMACFCMLGFGAANAAIVIKKAAPVADNSSDSGKSTTNSLVPSLIGFVAGVSSLNAQQKALTGDCIPTDPDMRFIDNMMKEWAKTGQDTSKSIGDKLIGRAPCSDCYSEDVRTGVNNTAGLKPGYNTFTGDGNAGKVWEGFPRPGKGFTCRNGAVYCTEADGEQVTDAYDIFNLIGFGPSDYLPSEASQAAKILEKTERCSDAKLTAKKRELWGAFLTQTASGLGKKTNTGNVMEQVGTITQSGGGALGAVSSLSGIATQFMNK